jgi:nitrate/TMAO reductase-like tetraheme cytochrome c subunit
MAASATDIALAAIVLGVAALVLLLGHRPSITAATGGKVLAFLSFFLLPVFITWGGTSRHIEHSKSTSFCLSCHTMEPYGQSLRIDSPTHLPAVHFQKRLVARDQACYTCHTTYTMFGDFASKMKGMKHVYVYYLGTIPEKIALYQPYSNRECLHCHEGARSFEEGEDHRDLRADLASGETSCLECHSDRHDVSALAEAPMWTGQEAGGTE